MPEPARQLLSLFFDAIARRLNRTTDLATRLLRSFLPFRTVRITDDSKESRQVVGTLLFDRLPLVRPTGVRVIITDLSTSWHRGTN